MVVCTGCQRDFKNTQELTKHCNTCQLALQNTTKLLNKRNEVLKMAKRRHKAEFYTPPQIPGGIPGNPGSPGGIYDVMEYSDVIHHSDRFFELSMKMAFM
jgi:hypothetical protein